MTFVERLRLLEEGNQPLTPAKVAYLAALETVHQVDPMIAFFIAEELRSQRNHLKLIASENYSSYAVQLAMGNWLTDKYAEGSIGKRFYAGCDQVDQLEQRGVDLAKQLFGAEYVYLQPHSGADANLIAFWAILTEKVQHPELLRLGKKKLEELTEEEHDSLRHLCLSQRLMGMSLDSGGHLTHGYLHNISSKIFAAKSYHVDSTTGLLDYGSLEEEVLAFRPLILLAGYSSYPRKINFAKMKAIAEKASAVLVVDMAHFAGLVAGKLFTGEYDPIPYADIITSTTHKTLRGPRGGIILAKKEYGDVLNRGCPLVMGGPMPHVMAAKAIAFQEALQPSFKLYAAEMVENSRILADELRSLGVRVITGGTDNHLVVFDVASFGITGRQAESVLRAAGITVNRNLIPNDPQSPWITSGIRIGTAAVTTLKMGREEMREIASTIHSLLGATRRRLHPESGTLSSIDYLIDDKVVDGARTRIKALLKRYPLYPEVLLPI